MTAGKIAPADEQATFQLGVTQHPFLLFPPSPRMSAHGPRHKLVTRHAHPSHTDEPHAYRHRCAGLKTNNTGYNGTRSRRFPRLLSCQNVNYIKGLSAARVYIWQGIPYHLLHMEIDSMSHRRWPRHMENSWFKELKWAL